MTGSEQHLKHLTIAHHCGWREAFPRSGPPHPYTKHAGILLPYQWVNETTHARVAELPDYFNDLNAMHEAEMCLDINALSRYADELDKLCVPVHICPLTHWQAVTMASAPERANAFFNVVANAAPSVQLPVDPSLPSGG